MIATAQNQAGSHTKRFFGKYRGTVVNNLDPLQKGRIQVSVPDVSNVLLSSWAVPCVPLAGKQMGAWFMPTIGAGVWVEFEQGDPDHPIWVGCFWGSTAEVPVLALGANPVSPSIVLQTGGQNTIVISDLPGPAGGIMLKTKTGAMISVSDTGIVIQNGKGANISLTGPTVNVNAGALSIT